MKKINEDKTCGLCATHGKNLKACSRCKLVYYCGPECQIAHWKQKDGGHKKYCIAVDERKPRNKEGSRTTTQSNQSSSSVSSVKCVICLDTISQANVGSFCTLPCSHIFHSVCMEDFRSHGATHQEGDLKCPLCRASAAQHAAAASEEDLSTPEMLFLKGCLLRDDYDTKMFGITQHPIEQQTKMIAEGVEIRAELAKLWGRAAASGYEPAKKALKALKVMMENDSTETGIMARAKAGDGDAQVELGHSFTRGTHGNPIDPKQAYFWFNKAAEQGVSDGEYFVGFCLSIGAGVALDVKRGEEWFRKAAAKENPNAQHDLGVAYRDGINVVKCLKTSEEWFLKAAKQNHIPGVSNLSILYLNTGQYEKCLPWMKKGAFEFKDPRAQYLLGLHFYALGKGGVKVDEALALKLFRLSASGSYPEAIKLVAQALEGKAKETTR
jgi:TPR repeat protein